MPSVDGHAGARNAAVPAAPAGAHVVASDHTRKLFPRLALSPNRTINYAEALVPGFLGGERGLAPETVRR